MSDLPSEEIVELRARCASLQQEHDELLRERGVLLRSLELHEQDRQLLAFEVHDGIVQDMAGSVMLLDAACRQMNGHTPEAKEMVERAANTLRGAVAEARRLIGGLIPVELDAGGLVASLQKLILRYQTQQGMQVQFDARVSFARLLPVFELTVLRIVQEALNNIWRHSQSLQAEVCLEQQGDQLLVRVRDWGVGFDMTQEKKSRYGLTGMRERARLLGGTAKIDSQPGQGTTVEVLLPLAWGLAENA
jgi:signal transduction histidine kinase